LAGKEREKKRQLEVASASGLNRNTAVTNLAKPGNGGSSLRSTFSFRLSRRSCQLLLALLLAPTLIRVSTRDRGKPSGTVPVGNA
jgi:hypothetical protein